MADKDKSLKAPEAVRDITRRLEESGFETWAVGGAVRDALLGDLRADWDLATAARPETVRKLFRPSYPIGLQFGTVGVRGIDGLVYEVTTFRRDIETDGRHAVVEYADTLDEDLGRRDFTINAIAYHPLHQKIHDPYHGRTDLQQRMLRCVGDPALRFAEDYLRVLRGLRFAGRFGLEIEPATWSALKAAVPLLPKLSGERVREELMKVLAAPAAAPALDLYRRSGALDALFGELAVLDDVAWQELLDAIDRVSEARADLRLALLFEPAGPDTELMMARVRFSNAETRNVIALDLALGEELPQPADAAAARRWLSRVTPQRAMDALQLHTVRAEARGADATALARLAERARTIREAVDRGDPVTVGDLAIDGNDLKVLGLPPGPDFGRILATLMDAVIEDPSLNRRETLLEQARRLLEEG
ncbi:MAG TPA: CCA tRNA nucleotidyltransferase [Gemmatimonadota bacterium]|nr:CCA tRNA nucleotidyltransferase [Gemmatimonadota bacterium]